MRIILHDDHGGQHDITEHVRLLYGHTVGSMDWDSGFLSTEEMLEVLEVGYLTGFESDFEGEIAEARRELESGLQCAEAEAARGGLNNDYWAEQLSKRQAFLDGLERIRESRAKLLALTEDVTGFDES